MKQFLTVVAVLGLLATGAQAADMRDSANWEGYYEGAIMPNVDTSFHGTAFTYSANPPALSLGTDGPIDYLNYDGGSTGHATAWYRKDIRLPDLDWGWYRASYEVRARLNSGNVWAQMNYGFSNPGHGWLGLGVAGSANSDYVGTEGYSLTMSCGTGAGGLGKLKLTPTQAFGPGGSFFDWHTYRITVTWNKDVPDFWAWADLYIDDNLTSLGSAGSPPGGPATGEIYNNDQYPYRADWDTDYIRWTGDGAFEPVPEPATLAVLGIGGMLVLLRRRR